MGKKFPKAHGQLPARLQELEVVLEMTKGVLASKAGVDSSGTYSRWYAGGYLQYETLYRFGADLGVNLNWLIIGDATEPRLRAEEYPLARAIKDVRAAAIEEIKKDRGVSSVAAKQLPDDDKLLQAVVKLFRETLLHAN